MEAQEEFRKKTRDLFVPEFQLPESYGLLMCTLGEAHNAPFLRPHEWPETLQIIQKRIEVMDLPIKFSPWGLAATLVFAKSPGQAVTLLIDCLDECEGETVTVETLCKRVYPQGFYAQRSFEYVIDEIHKKRKAKWSWVY